MQKPMQVCEPQNRFPCRSAVGFGLFVLLCLANVCFAAEALTFLDGSSRTGKIKSIDKGANVLLAESKHPFPLSELRSIQCKSLATVPPTESRVVVDLIAGGRFYADDIAIADEQCRLQGVRGTNLVLPIDLLVAVQLTPKNVDMDLVKSLKPAERDRDRIFVTIDGNIQAIDGLIEELSEERIVFQSNDESRTVARDKVVAIALANVGEPLLDEFCVVKFDDGAALRSQSISLTSDRLAMQVTPDAEVILPWDTVARIDIQTKRLAYLSDLKPISADHRPLVTSHRPWQRDRNIGGGQLRLGDHTFEKGIGVASQSRLVFRLNGEFAQFCAIVGIDAATQGRGNCVFVVRADGRELVRHQAKGGDPPRRLKIDVHKHDELELMVEYGDDLDLADHANWCEACLIRK